MAKPSDLGLWATTGGTTLVPSGGEKAAGFASGDKPPARWMNWLWNVAYQWHAYVDNLHNETQFLNKAYDWTAAHTFADDVDIAGDLTLDGASNEVLYSAARTLVRRILLTQSQGNWVYDPSDGAIKTSGANEGYVLPLDIPVGATLTGVAIGGSQASGSYGSALALTLEVGYWATSTGSPNAIGGVAGGAAYASGAGWAAIATPALTHTRNASEPLFVRIESSNSASLNQVGWLEYTYTVTKATGL